MHIQRCKRIELWRLSHSITKSEVRVYAGYGDDMQRKVGNDAEVDHSIIDG